MKNIKVMNTKPELTDGEIRSYMDFDALMARHKSVQKERRSIRTLITSVISLSIVGIIALVSFMLRNDNKVASVTSEKISPAAAPNRAIDSTTTTTTATTPSPIDKEAVQKTNGEKSRNGNRKNVEAKDEQAKKTNTTSTAPEVVYMQAAPVAGYPALYEYFAKELTYPPSRMKDSVNGVVSILFTIAKNGRPEKIEVEQSLGEEFDKEAIRVITNMPDWNPATYNGKPMASRISLPLTFQIRKIK